MKSKSFDLKSSEVKGQSNKVLDFVGLYKSASETNNILSEKTKQTEGQKNAKSKGETPKRESLPGRNRRKDKVDLLNVSHINIDGSNLNPDVRHNSPRGEHRVTSTPTTSGKSKSHQNRVKSIMKASANGDESMDSELDFSVNKPKKRNKSVSFMLDDNEEVVIKKTKSNDLLVVDKNKDKGDKSKGKDEKRKKFKKLRKEHEKENKVSQSNHIDTHAGDIQVPDKKIKTKGDKTKILTADKDATDSQTKKKKLKKDKKPKAEVTTEADTEKESGDTQTEVKKKNKKKKRKARTQSDPSETEGEPAVKTRKKDAKPDGIAEDLENLNIGDNPHTLTTLLDEMTVVDKENKRKLKQKFNKNKKPKGETVKTEDENKEEGEKEKVKWKKRKWNKDRKGGASDESIATTVIVEGLPISTIIGYKKLLTDHFQKFGLIKSIGIAEISTEDSKPVFTTTINFYSDGAAQEALKEDNTTLADTRIRLKPSMPPTETTLVVRSYAELTEQGLSSAFSGAGRIRSIRTLVKGKKAMSTAFIEFDGPESVEKALKMAVDAKMGGKKMHVAKFEIRKKKVEKKREVTENTEPARSDASDDESEDSD